jgi:hypothetical protein
VPLSADAGSPGEVPGPPRPARSLVWFYVLLGAAAALFALGVLLWHPLRASYWERQVRAAFERGDLKAAADALDRLEDMGPRARAAFARLLAPNGAWYRGPIIQDVGRRENRWLLPMIVRLVREDRDPGPAYLALSAAEDMTGKIFIDRNFLPRSREQGSAVDQGRERLLEWWDREGRDKHGGGTGL